VLRSFELRRQTFCKCIDRRGARGLLLAACGCLLAVVASVAALVVGSTKEARALVTVYPERTLSAPDFRNSIGVVTHSHYYDTTYGNWDRVVSLMVGLGVRHFRDDFFANPDSSWTDWNARHWSAIKQAGAAGMRLVANVGPPPPANRPMGSAFDIINRLLQPDMRGMIEAIEGPNEPDYFVGGSNWASDTTTFMQQVYSLAHQNGFVVAAPSLAFPYSNSTSLPGMENVSDLCNLHAYWPTNTLPSVDRLNNLWQAMQRSCANPDPSKWIITETGADTLNRDWLQQGRFVGRAWLASVALGFKRVYVYELLDEFADTNRGSENRFGLVDFNYLPKPSYLLVKNLLSLTSPTGGGYDSAPVASKVAVRSNNGSQLHSLIVATGTTKAALVVWSDADNDQGADVEVRSSDSAWRACGVADPDTQGRFAEFPPASVLRTKLGTSGIVVVNLCSG